MQSTDHLCCQRGSPSSSYAVFVAWTLSLYSYWVLMHSYFLYHTLPYQFIQLHHAAPKKEDQWPSSSIDGPTDHHPSESRDASRSMQFQCLELLARSGRIDLQRFFGSSHPHMLSVRMGDGFETTCWNYWYSWNRIYYWEGILLAVIGTTPSSTTVFFFRCTISLFHRIGQYGPTFSL